ncbi:MAG: hypothetical protein P9E88_04375, partial [Candidatus Competibacter sp.]|nr:hypothetical protein [Candidatus Competibacter sp.]
MSSEQPPVKRRRGKTAKTKAVDSASSSAAPTSLAPVPSLVGRLTRLPGAVADGAVRPFVTGGGGVKYAALSFDLILRPAAVLARCDPVPVAMQQDWGVGRLSPQFERERQFINLYHRRFSGSTAAGAAAVPRTPRLHRPARSLRTGRASPRRGDPTSGRAVRPGCSG